MRHNVLNVLFGGFVRAIILVGGEGTRLRPLTLNVPKAVVPVVNRPMMFYILEWLGKHGVKEAVLSACYKPDRLKKIIGNNFQGIKINYMHEASPLGTGGAIKRSEKFVEGTTVVMNGDVLTSLDLSAMLRFHRAKRSRMTLALTPVENPSAYGVVETKKDGSILRFLEKPSLEEVSGKEININAGVYLTEPGMLSLMDPEKAYSIERDVFPRLVGNGFYGYAVKNIYWMDLGTAEKYKKTNQDMLSGAFNPGIKFGIGKTVKLKKGARIFGPVSIDVNTIIGEDSKIGELTVLGSNCRIGRNSTIERSVIWGGVSVGDNCIISDCIIAGESKIGNNCIVSGGAVLGSKTILTPFSRIKS